MFNRIRTIAINTLMCFALSIAVISFGTATYAQGQPENCAVTPLQLMGQGRFAGTGAAGEIEDTINDNIVNPDWILDALSTTGSGSEPVAILVIDEFPPNENAGGDSKPETHGELVWEVLEHGLEQLEDRGINNIQLEQVNVAAGGSGNYKTNTIARDVGRAVTELRDEGVRRFVLNMSFVLIPCNDGGFSHQQFMNNHRNDPGKSIVNERGRDATIALLKKPKDGLDPLHDVIKDLNGRSKPDGFAIVAVAAAGNFGEPDPFYPAGWPEVIAVSGSMGDDIWEYSNQGQIMTPGAWYSFDDGFYRAGTSFAAPMLSLVSALYLSHDTSPCTFSSNAAPLTTPGALDNVPFSEGMKC